MKFGSNLSDFQVVVIGPITEKQKKKTHSRLAVPIRKSIGGRYWRGDFSECSQVVTLGATPTCTSLGVLS